METKYDIIIVSGEYYADHPFSGIGMIVKVLEDNGFSVAVIEKPDWKKDNDFLKFGKPRLFFGVSSGSIDSMLVNYTPLKKKRSEDRNNPYDSGIPDRSVIVYCNKLKQLFKETKIVIGGIESSMRRFAHYDYWDNDLRKSILLDSRADVLVYGNGEYQVVEIAKRMRHDEPLNNIEGTCIVSKNVSEDFIELPSFEQVSKYKQLFCRMQMMFSNNSNLAQKFNDRYVLQHKMHNYTTKDLDYIYGLDYSRDIPKRMPELKMAQFSVVTHRGCIGECNFCSLALHQGNRIISRSEESILNEIKKLIKHNDFKGFIDDLGGPSANMYGMDCIKCDNKKCISCNNLDRTHSRIISLLRKASKIKGVNKVFVRSGVRFDLAVDSEEYIKELSHHISGCLKIAPEHFCDNVLKLMNKYSNKFWEFKELFEKHNKPLGQYLKYYFMTGHPGSTLKEVEELQKELKKLTDTESIQLFTPTPMTISTCMYYTGLNPFNLEKVYVPYTYNEKKKQKNLLYR
jgi:uncharacterized radical SAM protein YgiQ